MIPKYCIVWSAFWRAARIESLSFSGDLAYFRIELEFQVPAASFAMGIN
jgi:hypothetical protein